MSKFNEKLLDELLKDYDPKNPDPAKIIGNGGLLKELSKAILERALKGEMTHHLGYPKSAPEGHNTGNSRNGKSTKKVLTEDGELEVDIPRDRNGSFEPQIVKKNQRRFDGFDDKILSLYARGMTLREIQGHLEDIYGVEVSPDLISTVTDEIITEVNEWNARSLDPVYLVVYLDAMMVKVRDEGQVKNKALYVAVGITVEGKKEILGLWITVNEGAKFWMSVISELKNRNVKDIMIACVDGLKGFPDAINAIFPSTKVQLCIVHMIRNSLKFVSWKDRKAVATDLKKIYNAINEQEALKALKLLCQKWEKQYPTVGKSWEANWANIVPFLTYPEAIRKVIYTTNAIESINRSLRKIMKNRTIFPNDTAVFKLAYMALKNIAKKWTMPFHNWSMAVNQFVILFGDRVQF